MLVEGLRMSVSPSIREVWGRRIAGEIILSGKPGATMRKWRGGVGGFLIKPCQEELPFFLAV